MLAIVCHRDPVARIPTCPALGHSLRAFVRLQANGLQATFLTPRKRGEGAKIRCVTWPNRRSRHDGCAPSMLRWIRCRSDALRRS